MWKVPRSATSTGATSPGPGGESGGNTPAWREGRPIPIATRLQADPTCKLVDQTCLVMTNGTCTNTQFRYQCGVDSSDLRASCEPINVCEGDNCEGTPPDPATSFGNAAAWLNLLAQMQEEFRDQNSTDPNDLKFFVGTEMTCSKAPGRDCCDGSGIFAQCSQQNEILWDMRQAGSTHYVGETCQQSVLGVCVKRRHYYCTYNSKLGRVFIEELKRLKGENWGPDMLAIDCGYATLEDLDNIDIDDMDLSPVFADMLNQASIPIQGALKDFYDQRFPSGPDDAQDHLQQRDEAVKMVSFSRRQFVTTLIAASAGSDLACAGGASRGGDPGGRGLVLGVQVCRPCSRSPDAAGWCSGAGGVERWAANPTVPGNQ